MMAATAGAPTPGALVDLAAALGFSVAEARSREEPLQLRLDAGSTPSERIAGLAWRVVESARDAYGEALTLRFLLGDLPVFDLQPTTDADALARAIKELGSSPTVDVELLLDKQRLLELWLGSAVPFPTTLFLFPDCLHPLLGRPTWEIEEYLATGDRRPRVLAVAGEDVWMRGRFLVVAGGRHLTRLPQLLRGRSEPDVEPQDILQGRQNANLSWSGFELERVTPLHLLMEDAESGDGETSRLLARHLLTTFLAFTADRSLATGGQLCSTYAAREWTAEAALAPPGSWDPASRAGLAALPQLQALARLAAWVYEDSQTTSSRLAVVQLVVARALAPGQRDGSAERLILSASRLDSEARHAWKSFVDGRLEKYFQQLRDLEDLAASTAKAHAEAVADLAGELVKNMLAAVAVVIGSFLGAFLANPFSATVVRAGLIVYGAYVVVFPLLMDMLQRWGRFRATCTLHERSSKELSGRLLAGETPPFAIEVAASESRFRRWYWTVLSVYVIVGVASLVLGVLVNWTSALR
jgi:hypothetical protein